MTGTRPPFQHLQPAARVQFGQGTLVFGCSSALGLVWQEHQQGGLASNPPAQWSLVVAKPDLQHGIRRCDLFSGGRKHFECWLDPVCENVSIFRRLSQASFVG